MSTLAHRYGTLAVALVSTALLTLSSCSSGEDSFTPGATGPTAQGGHQSGGGTSGKPQSGGALSVSGNGSSAGASATAGGGNGASGANAQGGAPTGGQDGMSGSNAQGGQANAGQMSYGGGGGQPPRIEGGQQGWASRYWDCCKPACGWQANVPQGSTPVHSCSENGQSLGGNYSAKNACEAGGSAYMCQDFGPWAVSDTLAYGYAAVNMGDYCGKCFQLQFTGSSRTAGNDPGAQSLAGKTMIVQAINNGGVGSDQFDLLIPGGGVGDFDACSHQWGTSELGERYGGFYLACQKQHNFNHGAAKSCAEQKCRSVLGDRPDLLNGCLFFVNWFNAPDNPNLVFKEVPCPEALTAKSGLRR
jgi:hypothetical protein